MKQLTCGDLGGVCETVISGDTSLEMMHNWKDHMKRAHPDEANLFRNMSQDEKDAWEDDFQSKWEEAAEQ